MQEGRIQSEEIPLDQATTMQSVAAQAEARALQGAYGEEERRVVLQLLRAFVVENTFYDEESTRLRKSRARAEVEPVTEKLARGQVLVRRGDLVSDTTARKIDALGAYAKTLDVNAVLGSGLFLLLTFALALYLLSLKGSHGPVRRGQALLIMGMGLGHIIVSALVVRFAALPDWVPLSVAIPTSAMAMLVAILVSTPVGIFFSLAVSLMLLLLTAMGMQVFLFAFLSGVAATAVVLNAEKRIDLVRAGLLLSLADAAILLVLGLLGNYTPRMILSLLGWGIANGFLCGILTLGFLPILELLLNAPTRFKLMELSDLNSPVFKRMLSQAPGTYTHSISVANLAETASEAIGANALLARVSAYYHDIGKVDQADYFVENQKTYNRHDTLRPSLSVAVIKSHVRIGIEKARELKLPQAIIDIIAQHHGRGLITYFYHRAVKEGKNPRVSRDDYSYPGVRPRSKEAAVLMLADSVEAASRTLKRPTEARLDSFVHELIMEKFTSGSWATPVSPCATSSSSARASSTSWKGISTPASSIRACRRSGRALAHHAPPAARTGESLPGASNDGESAFGGGRRLRDRAAAMACPAAAVLPHRGRGGGLRGQRYFPVALRRPAHCGAECALPGKEPADRRPLLSERGARRGPRVTGDIALSLPALRRNAREFGVHENEELKRLLVHGILHLAGMDHGRGKGARMLALQEELLERLRGERIIGE